MLVGRALGLVVLVGVIFSGCSGKSKSSSHVQPGMTAGKSSTGAGGGAGEESEGGSSPDGTAARAGSFGAGQGGSSGGGAGAGAGGVATAGAAGANAHGGFAGVTQKGGAAGRETTGGAAGSAGSSPTVPAGWTCQTSRYSDGKSCDCGCGAPDPDCKDETAASCDACLVLGGCGHAPCPSNILPDDNTHCASAPGWLCDAASYGNGTCDCGCGALDIDCTSAKADACEFCPIDGCAKLFDCSTIDPDDNSVCTAPPTSWTCSARLYRDGTQCDCGCGFFDPDCSARDVGACDACNDPGSCSHQPCSGTINPSSNALCIQPAPPPEWTCDPSMYADAKQCDCGCGAHDPDCPDNSPDSCGTCGHCGSACPASVQAADPTQCIPAPPGWTCAPSSYADFNCDCGCGVLDPDCVGNMYCEYCDGCPGGWCGRLDPNDITKCVERPVPDGWTCPPETYWDGDCDCGCGAADYDCASLLQLACDRCDDPGSCSTADCSAFPNPINAHDNTSCSN